MDKQTLKAENRKILGRKVKALRKEGILPGNVYGKGVKSTAVQVDGRRFGEIYKEVGETGLLELVLGNKKSAVLIHKVQVDSVSDKPLHVDFLQVDLGEKVTANIPVELTGGSPAEKQSVGTVVLYINQIGVKALPADLPEKFTIDVSGLAEVDQAVHVKDLPFDKKKVEVSLAPETIVVKVEPPQKEEEIVPDTFPVTEVPKDAGETPSAEGKPEIPDQKREEKK